MSLRFATIASSSSGNCVYVGTENTNILIDAGLSGKRLKKDFLPLDLQETILMGYSLPMSIATTLRYRSSFS